MKKLHSAHIETELAKEAMRWGIKLAAAWERGLKEEIAAKKAALKTEMENEHGMS